MARTQPYGFKILKNVKMPDKNSPRHLSRLENLLQRPLHKPQREKSTLLPIHERNNSPMTMEDKGSVNDRIYIYSLRKNLDAFGNQMTALNKTDKNGAQQVNQTTIVNPPSFYEDDIDKWKKKFETQVNERQAFKRKYYKDKDADINPYLQNTNVLNQTFLSQAVIQKPKHLSESLNNKDALSNGDTLYKKVMARRRSRQSTYGFLNVDIDYAGNTNNFQHLIHQRIGQTVSPNKTQLDFEMKLRNYQNKTRFIAPLPFSNYQLKKFDEKEIYQKEQDFLNSSIKNYQTKFQDKFVEKNQNNLEHLRDKYGTIYSAMWECNLRQSLNKRNSNQSRTTQPSPLKRKQKD